MAEVTAGWKLVRSVAALIGAAGLAVALFALLPPIIHRWGATDEEVAAPMAGDQLLSSPAIVWSHGITIHAAPHDVWPWIAQIGDRRGGFYSYTFIENLIARGDIYRNADRIVPELQHPAPGTPLIEDFLSVAELVPGRYLLATADPKLGIGWSWIWALKPLPEGATRMAVRCRIQPAVAGSAAASLGVGGTMIDLGGFVMEQKMLQGIKLRAEGGGEPPALQYIEIALWLMLLAEGVAAGGLFVVRRVWWRPLVVAAAALLLLFAFTFVQPGVWVRLLLVLATGGGVAWAWGPARREHATRSGASSPS